MDRPSGLAADADDNIFVVDHMNNRIQKRRPDGSLVSQWGSAGDGPGEFNLPWGVCTDKDGNVYVADWRNDRIQKFTNDGQYISTIGSSGSEHRPAEAAGQRRRGRTTATSTSPTGATSGSRSSRTSATRSRR